MEVRFQSREEILLLDAADNLRLARGAIVALETGDILPPLDVDGRGHVAVAGGGANRLVEVGQHLELDGFPPAEVIGRRGDRRHRPAAAAIEEDERSAHQA